MKKKILKEIDRRLIELRSCEGSYICYPAIINELKDIKKFISKLK